MPKSTIDLCRLIGPDAGEVGLYHDGATRRAYQTVARCASVRVAALARRIVHSGPGLGLGVGARAGVGAAVATGAESYVIRGFLPRLEKLNRNNDRRV